MTRQPKLPGVLIAFEGIDGTGKSTQLRLLRQWLLGRQGRVTASEWSSSELVMGATIRGKNRRLLTPTTFSLIHATDFADRYECQILPMLKGGCIVLADRYIFTSFVRDEVRGLAPEWLRMLYSFAHLPEITLYFDAPLHIAIGRTLQAREDLKFFDAGLDLGLSTDPVESFRLYQGRMQDIYRRLIEPYGFFVVDASAPIQEQQQILRRHIENTIDLDRFRRRTSA